METTRLYFPLGCPWGTSVDVVRSVASDGVVWRRNIILLLLLLLIIIIIIITSGDSENQWGEPERTIGSTVRSGVQTAQYQRLQHNMGMKYKMGFFLSSVYTVMIL